MSEMTPSEELYRGATRISAAVILVFGVVIVIRTIAAGGSVLSMGILIGLVFCGLGAGRLYLSVRRDEEEG